MLENKLKYIIRVFPKSDFQASVAQPEGLHPFYTSSQELTSFCDIAKYPSDSITMGTGGNACVNYSAVPFSTSTDCFNFRCTKNNTKFLYYWIYSKLNVIDDLYFWGMGLRHLQKPLFCNQHIMLPSMDEQEQIVNYLDKKVGIVDKLIANITQQIEELKQYRKTFITEIVTKGLNKNIQMKSSNIDWIGKIPAHWNVYKIKNIICAGSEGIKIGPFGSALKGKTKDSGECRVYSQANLITNSFDFANNYISKKDIVFFGNYIIKPGNILLSMMGTIGKCKIMPENKMLGIMDSHLLKIRLNKLCLPNFFALVYDKDSSNVVMPQLLYYSKGSIMDGLNSTIVKTVKIPLPPISEQMDIEDYLVKECEKIDKLLRIKQQKVSELKEYKKSLIYECVTGKKEVL